MARLEYTDAEGQNSLFVAEMNVELVSAAYILTSDPIHFFKKNVCVCLTVGCVSR